MRGMPLPFHRKKTEAKRNGRHQFRLTAKRKRLLELLADYFCLRVKDLAELFHERTPTEADLCGARHTLDALHREGYVHRIAHFEPSPNAWKGNNSWVYGLSDKGVKDFGGKTFDEHSERTLDHELEISCFHIALVRFWQAADSPELYWQQTDLKRGIHPDALFKLRTPKGEYAFFLEIEKSKVGNVRDGEPSIVRKLQRYAEYYDTDQCQNHWGFRKFRVIVVHKNWTRTKNLLDVLNGSLPHRMFWLTAEEAYKSRIGEEIFQTPKDHDKIAYSFLSL